MEVVRWISDRAFWSWLTLARFSARRILLEGTSELEQCCGLARSRHFSSDLNFAEIKKRPASGPQLHLRRDFTPHIISKESQWLQSFYRIHLRAPRSFFYCRVHKQADDLMNSKRVPHF